MSNDEKQDYKIANKEIAKGVALVGLKQLKLDGLISEVEYSKLYNEVLSRKPTKTA